MTDISIFGQAVPAEWLSPDEVEYFSHLPEALPTVDWVWAEMDRVWHQFGLNNRQSLEDQKIGEFYSHPVWLMNGVFTLVDPISALHRDAIARYLGQTGARRVADYGGGFGELARAITRAVPDAEVSIVEPYPSRVGLERLRDDSKIRFVPSLSAEAYDAIVAQDVLEHVSDPVQLASDMADVMREGGVLIFANCFYPVIQCHLPSTFHLRQTFPMVMKALGLDYLGRVEGAAHAQVFRRTGRLDLVQARRAERISKVVGPVLNHVRAAMSRVKRLVVR